MNERIRKRVGASGRVAACLFVLVSVLAGCSLFRVNPLEAGRGAVVLVFDTRTCGDLKKLRRTLSGYGARATVFAGGRITRRRALELCDLRDDGCEIGLSGLKGLNPQSYSLMYGRQKYFQDEIVTQLLDARHYGINPRHFLLPSLVQAKSETLALPPFLVSKGFARVVHKMPTSLAPRAKPLSDVTSPMLHTYAMATNNFDRTQIAALAKHNEVLIVSPDRQVLPMLLEEAKTQNVPFATVGELKVKR